jgi:hypothetical protein
VQLDLSGVVALVVAVYTLYKVYRMTPKEMATADADAADKYATAAGKTAQQNLTLVERIEVLEKRVSAKDIELEEMRIELRALRRKLRRRDALIAIWQQGIDKLINQLCEVGKEPIWKPDMFADISTGIYARQTRTRLQDKIEDYLNKSRDELLDLTEHLAATRAIFDEFIIAFPETDSESYGLWFNRFNSLIATIGTLVYLVLIHETHSQRLRCCICVLR